MIPADLAGRLTLTVPETARALNIGRDACYHAIERGEIPVLRIGRRLLVPVPRLLALVGATPDMSEAGTPIPATATTAPTHGVRHEQDNPHGSPRPLRLA